MSEGTHSKPKLPKKVKVPYLTQLPTEQIIGDIIGNTVKPAGVKGKALVVSPSKVAG